MLRPFEHQVLEEVRKSGMARPLVLRTDVIPEVDRHDRARAILVQKDVETVVERVFRERDLQFLKLPQVGIALP
jgi:hypothetical protein